MGLPGNADVAELVDALDLGSSAERRGGSSPFIRTMFFRQNVWKRLASQVATARQGIICALLKLILLKMAAGNQPRQDTLLSHRASQKDPCDG